MPRVRIGEFAPTVGSASSTFIADPANANVTITTALSQYAVVFVREGTYTFSNTLSIQSGKTLLGQPDNRPTLKMTAGTNKTVITNANASSGGLTTGVTLKSIIIDQQGVLQTAGGGIVVTGIQNWVMQDVWIKKSYRFNFLCLHQSVGVANNLGTISLTKGSSVAAGAGTSFTSQIAVGDILKSAGGQFCRVLSIQSDTSLTLTLPWASATETGVTYKTILPNSGNAFTRMKYDGTVNDADASGYGFFDNGIVSDSIATSANTGGCGFVPDHARSMQLNNLVGYGNDNSGISLETCEDCVINDPVLYGNINGNGLQFISGTSRCTVNRGKSTNHTNNGYVVSYNNTNAGVPIGNVFANCSGSLNGGYAFRNDGGSGTEYNTVTGFNNDTGGIIINTANSNPPNAVNVHDSLFYDDRGGAKSQDRGIYVVAGTNATITNNNALDTLHVIAGIVNTATNTTLVGNTTT